MVENGDWIFLKTANQSYLVKIVLIPHNKCSLVDIAQNSGNSSHNENRTITNFAFNANGWVTRMQLASKFTDIRTATKFLGFTLFALITISVKFHLK